MKLITILIVAMFLIPAAIAGNEYRGDNGKGPGPNPPDDPEPPGPGPNPPDEPDEPEPIPDEPEDPSDPNPSTSTSTSTSRGSSSLSSPYMGYWNTDVMEGDYVPMLFTWHEINNKRVKHTTDYFPYPGTYRIGVIITPARFAGEPVPDYFWETDQGKRVLIEIN